MLKNEVKKMPTIEKMGKDVDMNKLQQEVSEQQTNNIKEPIGSQNIRKKQRK